MKHPANRTDRAKRDPRWTTSSVPRRAAFALRPRCIACDSAEFSIVWAGRFDEPPTANHLLDSHYSGDWRVALEGERFELAACARCGQLWHRRVLAPEWLEVLYGEWIDRAQARRFEAEHSPARHHRFNFGRQLIKHVLRISELLADIAERRPLRVVDYGCGDGAFLRAAALFGFDARGIDLSATRRDAAMSSGVPIHASWEELDATGPLDAVCLFEVLEHLPDPLGTLAEATQRLRSGGVAVIEVPDVSGVRNGDHFEDFHKLNPLEHLNGFTGRTLDALCRKVGLVRISKPVAHVSTRRLDLARTEAGRVALPLRMRGTAGYFRYVP